MIQQVPRCHLLQLRLEELAKAAVACRRKLHHPLAMAVLHLQISIVHVHQLHDDLKLASLSNFKFAFCEKEFYKWKREMAIG